MSNILKKQYFKITFDLASPMAIGCGINKETDQDVLKDSKGIPFIPGSAIAGMCTDLIGFNSEKNQSKKQRYLGDVSTDGKGENFSSKVVFYDAYITNGTPHISRRDGVALDDYKTAKKGAKFDMEVLDPSVSFATYIEQNFYNSDDEEIALHIVKKMLTEKIYFGAKTMRGYGLISNVNASIYEVDFSDKQQVEKWLDFDMYDDWAGDKVTADSDTYSVVLRLTLEQAGGISIRKYTTGVSEIEGKSLPDSEQLTVITADGEKPTIPGTTWAGAISHRMLELEPELDKAELFGFVGKDKKKKSNIRFSESQLKGASAKVMTRNAINRFTGGTANTALFTEKTYYGGKTELVISFRNLAKVSDAAKNALAAAVSDLSYGFLGVGGLTSIGRGLFKVTEVNGQPVVDKEVFDTVRSVLS